MSPYSAFRIPHSAFHMSILARIRTPGPKRILALDGGGIRGAVTVGFLKKIEQLLRDRSGQPGLVLSDYFDLVGGTSTGSIIATLLALGYPTADIERMYKTLGPKIFEHKYSGWNPLDWGKIIRAAFDPRPLEAELRNILRDDTLGSDKLKTALCIVAKRADTFSTWPMHNNPEGKYFGPPYNNKDLTLFDLVRASTAAPSYFQPHAVHLGDQEALFIDGGVSSANNPAWQLFLMATLPGYHFNWPTGENQLLLVSIGTGTHTKKKRAGDLQKANLLHWAKELPDLFMEDATWQNQTMMHYLSRSQTPHTIDGEIGNMRDALLHGVPLLTYLRYNTWLEKPKPKPVNQADQLLWFPKPDLTEHGFTEADLEDMREMSNAKRVNDLTKVGEISADFFVQEGHFPKGFDVA
ncbi:MAG: patatin-like phospholipase family protein [Saprospiraceae bacterium]